MKKATMALLFICVAVFAQEKGTFTDSRDGKKYKTVKIGQQTWMAENLNYAVGGKCYGESGKVVTDFDEEGYPAATKTISEKDVKANCTKYGRLYDWNTAMEACPSGWHLPDDGEWDVLLKIVGGEKVAGKKLKAKSGWSNGGNGTDEYGFSLLPGGDGSSNGGFGSGRSDGSFSSAGGSGFWWSATEGWYRMVSIYSEMYRSGVHRADMFYVRCLQD